MNRNKPARIPSVAAVASIGLLVACAPSERRGGAGEPEMPKPVERSLVGPATVIDGDTVAIQGRRIRLLGIDAPEARQTCGGSAEPWPCGRRAARALAARVARQPVACRWREQDRWGRPLAACRVGRTDLSAWMVGNGWALAFRRYSTAYVDAEAKAQAARRGVWRGTFVAPWDHRAAAHPA
jgi:endonuclease YncB( thermonuclease family)